jgi:hypothetical protein
MDKHCLNRAPAALVHRLMHTSVEKHSLRIAKSCGTLALVFSSLFPDWIFLID